MAVDAWSDGWTKPPTQIAESVRAWREGGDVDARMAQLCAEVARRYSGRFQRHPRLAAYAVEFRIEGTAGADASQV
jgi:hypothetical protein